MKRVVIPELLDTDSGSPEEVRSALADLVFFNRYFGGHTTTCRLLFQIAKRKNVHELSFLDVGGGTGDFMHTVQQALSAKGLAVHCAILDRAATHLMKLNGFLGIAADALHMPLKDRAFDVVGSNLFCHHLEPKELTAFLREALRACRIAVIVNDLRRNFFHLAAAYAGSPIYRSRITRNDAPASVLRAYTAEELLGMLRSVPASRIDLKNFYFQRMGAILWR